MEWFQDGAWLPLVFMLLMGIAILVYVVLDGYDLGVGILMTHADKKDRDLMIASIGPFWDANETWLVLGVGILLVAFPMAHGMILTALYIPTALMLIGLILRGVAFDFRAKAKHKHKDIWDRTFTIGSWLAAVSQGYMLGSYIMAFENTPEAIVFSLLTGACLAAGYAFVGASWLIMKTESALQVWSVQWARKTLWVTALGMGLVSLVTPLVNERIFGKWFSLPTFLYLLPIPLIAGALILFLDRMLRRLPLPQDQFCWVPFVGSIGLYITGFLGLGYSFFPYIVPDKMTIWQAASAHESLLIILIGALVVLPFIFAYTIYVYKLFHGKVRPLEYY